MSPTLNSLSKHRCNTTKACDSCRRLKIKCKNAAYQSAKCSECIKRNNECTYSTKSKKRGPKSNKNPANDEKTNSDSSYNEHQDELFHGLSQEEIKLVTNLFKTDQLSLILDTLTSTSSLPCPYENIPGHYCHIGCIVRYKNNC